MLIKLYHGTNVQNAKRILKEGLKDRIESKRKNWEDNVESQSEFVYLTRAYPFYYAMNAAKSEDNEASVLLVEVDTKDLYPDEDFLRQSGLKDKPVDIRDYKKYASMSLEKLGNVAIRPSKIKHIIGQKTFEVDKMLMYSDPSMSILNYRFLGDYYRKLTDTWWNNGDWEKINITNTLVKKSKKHNTSI